MASKTGRMPNKKRGEAAVAGCEPFDELLAIALVQKGRYKRARGKAIEVCENRYMATLFQLLPYTRPRLNSVNATVDSKVEFVVQIGGDESPTD